MTALSGFMQGVRFSQQGRDRSQSILDRLQEQEKQRKEAIARFKQDKKDIPLLADVVGRKVEVEGRSREEITILKQSLLDEAKSQEEASERQLLVQEVARGKREQEEFVRLRESEAARNRRQGLPGEVRTDEQILAAGGTPTPPGFSGTFRVTEDRTELIKTPPTQFKPTIVTAKEMNLPEDTDVLYAITTSAGSAQVIKRDAAINTVNQLADLLNLSEEEKRKALKELLALKTSRSNILAQLLLGGLLGGGAGGLTTEQEQERKDIVESF